MHWALSHRLCTYPRGSAVADLTSNERVSDDDLAYLRAEYRDGCVHHRLLSELIDRRAAETGCVCWRDIHTAPRDGRPLLLFGPTHGLVEGSWEQVDGGGHPENGPPVYWWTSPRVEFIDGPYDAPTHWMPFPDLPLQVKTTCSGDES